MGHPRGFLDKKRETAAYRPVTERVQDHKLVVLSRSPLTSQEQASRCMECGIPFCQFNCPVENIIPEWNDAMFRGDWKRAYEILQSTNPFPEFTGLVCPATCEAGCVAGINVEPVTIRENERDIIEYAFKKGWVHPHKPAKRTGKKVAVVGAGPAGLAAAYQLNRLGHTVTLFEKDHAVGGMLRYGIPDFKLEKKVIDRRVGVMKKEGVVIKTGVAVTAAQLKKEFDAIALTTGARQARDLSILGRELNGIHLAMDYLTQQNLRNAGVRITENSIWAEGKKVVVIGGGDTGADCVGLANRQRAARVMQIELLPKPPAERTDAMPWPQYPRILRTSSSHEEGCERRWSVATKAFEGEAGAVKRLRCVDVTWGPEKDARGFPAMKENGDPFIIEADLVILAMGFVHPEHAGLLDTLELDYDNRGNVKTTDAYATNKKGVFAAGDCRRGASLVVWAIHEGVEVAQAVDRYLMK